MELTKNRAELAVLRGKRAPEHMALWVQAFADGDEALANRYAIAVATFLGDGTSGEEWASYVGKLSPRTREAYAFAVTEFFEWAARQHGQIVPPHKVLRKDAEDYANWLSNRPFSLTEEKLNDFDQERRRTIYETVAKVGPADRRSIYGALPASMKPGYTLELLTSTLGRMVLHDLLDRSPTLSQVRVDHPRAGIDQNTIMVPGPDPDGPWVPMELSDVFQYAIPRPRGVSRSTIALRLSALSTFWDVLAQGENVPGGQAIIQHNIFKGMKKRVTRGLSRERKASSASRRMDPSLVPRLLNAANLAKTLPEKRDKALIYFLVFTGSRLSEAVNLRRGEPPASEINRWPGWFVGNTEPPVVRVRRKGGKLQSLPFPPVALRALADFQADLDRRSAPLSAQSSDPKAPHYLHPNSPRWRYRELARASDAPLFPPVHFWGANSTYNYQEFKPNAPNTYGPPTYRRSMSKAGVYQLLVRLARRAGLVESEIEQVHPHALRHFAATAMAKGGKDLREIQAILGHESVTTTEGYLADVESVVALSGQAEILEYLSQFEGAAEAVPPPPPHGPKAPPRREVIETYGIPAPAAPSRAPREQEPQVPGAPRPRPPKPTKPGKAPKPAGVPPPLAARATPEETAAVQAVVPTYVAPEELPPHAVATVPQVTWPGAGSVPTAAGRVTVYQEPPELGASPGRKVVAVEGEPVPDEVKADIALNQIRDKQSPGSPEDVYEAMERGDLWERIEFTRMRPRKHPRDDDLVTLRGTKERNDEQVQTRSRNHEFLATFYDPWPSHYGIGTVSLLPWFTRGNPDNQGRITAEDPTTRDQVQIPPLPVLSPEQVYAETTGTRVLDGLEALYGLWLNGDPAQGIAPSPSRTFGLVRWYGFFAHTTGALQAFLRDKKKEYDRIGRSVMGTPVANVPTWVPWNVIATVGKNVRAHKDEWVLAWFKENAHTFTATRRAFEKAIEGKADEESMKLFKDSFEAVTAESVALRTTLPEWFADDDPVNALYKKDPKEWETFATWIANITGQKLGAQRREARAEAAEYAGKSWEEKRDEARDLLRQHTEVMAKLRFITLMLAGRRPVLPENVALSITSRTGEVDDLKADKLSVEWERQEIVRALQALNMPDPLELAEVRGAEAEIDAEAESDAKAAEVEAKAAKVDVSELPAKPQRQPLTAARVNELLKEYFPAPPEEEDANLLRSSPLFDARMFNIDYRNHTISHTPEYREAFAEQYDDRDSELVMRRSARAMWEYAKTHTYLLQAPEARESKKKREGYGSLYAVMLCQIAWVIPAPEEMERQAVASGRVRKLGPEARKDYLASQASLLYELAYGRKPEPKLALTGPQAQEERVAYVMRALAEKGSPRTEAEVRAAWASFDVANVIFGETELSPEAQSREFAAYLGREGFMTAHATREGAEAERAEERKTRRGAAPKKPKKVAEAATAEPVEVEWVAPKLKEGERVITQGVLKRGSKLTANTGASITFEYMANESVNAWYRVRCEFLPPDGKRYMANKGAVAYVSPAAMADKRRFLVNAQSVLPSPLAMIAAMNLAAVEA